LPSVVDQVRRKGPSWGFPELGRNRIRRVIAPGRRDWRWIVRMR
jgi:hypothetical protein